MKTLENIEIYDINTYKNVVTVEYGMEGCDVTLQINKDTLVAYIEANELNTVEFINYSKQTLECDGYDEKKVCPENYLDDNLFDVVKSYLEENHNAE